MVTNKLILDELAATVAANNKDSGNEGYGFWYRLCGLGSSCCFK